MQNTKLFKLSALSLLFLLTYQSSIYAQQRWSAGPRLGVNLSNLTGNDENHRKLTGVAVGAFLMYSDESRFGVSLDALYSQKGYRYVNNGARVYRQRLNYLELPLLFRYFLNASGDFRPNLFIGPNVGIRLNGNRTSPDIDNTQDFRPVDIGITGGLSLNFRIRGTQRLHIDGRYTHGFSDATEPNRGTLPATVNRNTNFALTLGYGFGIGRRY